MVGQNAYAGWSSVELEEAGVQEGIAGATNNWYDEVTAPGFDSQHINPFV